MHFQAADVRFKELVFAGEPILSRFGWNQDNHLKRILVFRLLFDAFKASETSNKVKKGYNMSCISMSNSIKYGRKSGEYSLHGRKC